MDCNRAKITNGNVGIGTTSPTSPLDIQRDDVGEDYTKSVAKN